MATWLPIRGSFITWANRYIDRNVACAISWNYWLTTTMTICAESESCFACDATDPATDILNSFCGQQLYFHLDGLEPRHLDHHYASVLLLFQHSSRQR